jgi:hypothetical protein
MPPTDATTITPASTLDLSQRTDQYYGALQDELRPQSALAAILVRQIARDAAGLDFGAAAAAAATRAAAENGEVLNLFSNAREADRPFLAALQNGLVAAASRIQARHQRGLHAALRELREIARLPAAEVAFDLFADEESCIAYLAHWQQSQPWQCPACGSHKRYFLPSRAKFECTCKRQASLREGTVCAGTKLPLLTWFDLILQLIVNPDLPTSQLEKKINVVRRGTLRKMRHRVRSALVSDRVDELLAGLPSCAADHLRKVSQRRGFIASTQALTAGSP